MTIMLERQAAEPGIDIPDEVPGCDIYDHDEEDACGHPAVALMMCEIEHLACCDGQPGTRVEYTVWACAPHYEETRIGRLFCNGCTAPVVLIRCL